MPRLHCMPPACLVVVWLALVSLHGCGRPPDGIVESGTVASRRSGASHARVEAYATPASGVQLWYERFGLRDSPVLVLINGNDSQAIYWPLDFVVSLVDAGFDVVRYDPRDVGLSEWLPFPDGFEPERWTPAEPPPYPLEAHVDDLFGLMDALGIEKAHLMGVSQGGMVAQLAAITQPSRVLTLTLLSTSPSNPYDDALGALDPELLAYLQEQYPRVGETAFFSPLLGSRTVELLTDLLARVAGVSGDQRDVIRGHVQASYDRAGINPASSQGFAVASAGSRLEALRHVDAPTLIFHGREDRFFLPSHAIALAAALPQSRLIWTEGGHGFPFEMFSERTEVIVDHLGSSRP